MKKLMLGLMMALAATAAMAETVTYLDYDVSSGTFTNATAECTVVTSETTAFADGGWYVAKGTSVSSAIAVSGSAHLILADGAELTINNGIRVSEGNSLTIYGQDEGSGKLIASGGHNGYPGIGGGLDGESCGAITVNGGSVVAESNGGVGIGGVGGETVLLGDGGSGGNGGSLTVNGGSVTTSKKIGGGAGGSSRKGNAGSPGRGTRVTLMGGVTEAQGGIFTDCDPILAIYMKVVEGDFNEASYIKVAEQERQNTRDVVFVLGECVISITTDYTGESLFEGNRVTLKDAKVGAQIGIEVTCAPGFEYRGATEFVVRAYESPHELNAVSMPVEVLESVEYAVPGESTLSVARNVATVVPGPHTFTNGGWYVTRSKWSCGVIEVNGSANLILADGAELTVNGGIRVTAGNSLTIYGQCEGSGKLIATGAEGCAGIGGGGAGGSCGVVTLNGGIVTATGGTGAAGIGGGAGAAGMDGYTEIDSGTDGGAGGPCGVVTLNGGIVTATGGTGAAGIGGGAGGAGGNVGTVMTMASELAWDSVRSGNGGDGGAGGTVIINAGIVTASGGTGAAGFGGGVGGIRGTGARLSSFEGRNGSNGAGATVTFLGGVTEAQSGIFTKGEPTLGENVEVTGKFNVLARIVVFEADAIALGHKDHPWAAGDTVTAHTNGTTLVIEGTGAMYDFEDATDVPWAAAADKVTTVTVANTVTHVGKNALAGFTDAVTVNGTPISFYDMMASARGLSEPVIPDDKVLVAKEELQAAKAEAVTVADGVVSLGVTVNTNGNFTAETKSWAPVELKSENVKVENGKIVISIPVSDKSGFMILQSGDAKVVPSDELKLSGGKVFTGDY